LSNYTYAGLLKNAQEKQSSYKVSNDNDLTKFDFKDEREEARDKRHEAG
jgi:hypothetical protein